ncbi:MAG: hypothetical protein H7Y11_13710, partial [Armatimonadetes bacterium]|nr:hypothetical protein [Anaerolineae bacterium]
NYGDEAIGRLLLALTPDSQAAVVADAAGVASLGELDVDWRGFLTWRLRLENTLFSQANENAYVALYAPQFDTLARGRYTTPLNPTLIPQGEVTQVMRGVGSEGTPQLEAVVFYTTANDTQLEARVLFRLVGQTWLRAN